MGFCAGVNMVLCNAGHLSERICGFSVLNMWFNLSESVFDRTLSGGHWKNTVWPC